jgi:hypothetical protein
MLVLKSKYLKVLKELEETKEALDSANKALRYNLSEQEMVADLNRALRDELDALKSKPKKKAKSIPKRVQKRD